ncbi:hypothetical protein [Pontibacter cellulosilyticus]|uniref:DUF4177 domain-containing protein n=1 Tax=Pontibacter cellulosilyticus TaxID=1720253 RepID=A0A923N5T1_9BACT|nr:hypothetical protein [Pontibacter cellulosilyticus]MBC5992277.1 hypothetical protein [Pontibacter cellulosilyticus]
MKKATLLFFIAFGLGFSAQAQEQQQNSPQTQIEQSDQAFEYMAVTVDFKHRIKGWSAYLNDNKDPDKQSPVNDAAGNLRSFSSPYDVMNYLGSQGWEFAAYTPDLNGKLTWEKFLMKRKVKKA